MKVDSGSLIYVDRKVYSVPSRILLRNTFNGCQLVSEGRRFLCQPQHLPFVVNFIHLSECGLLVLLSRRNQVI